MKRVLHPEELELWMKVAATVRPRPGTLHAKAVAVPVQEQAAIPRKNPAPSADKRIPAPHHPPNRVRDIEPNRKKRLVRERDDLEGRLDLHGLNHDQAKAVLTEFVQRAYKRGYRAILVITGKGRQGEGILRRYVPEWLGNPPLSGLVAGLSTAHRNHGGDGALYVALKRSKPERDIPAHLPIPG